VSKAEFRRYTLMDRLLSELDQSLNNIFCQQHSSRPYPARETSEEQEMSAEERRASAGMMRVNHAGEMAAQALYQGQSWTARDPSLREKLRQASIEEADHLNWCRRRLEELDARPSCLDPLWYLGSLCIGVAAGVAGDRWNLGFLAETEHQVVQHLDSHLKRLSGRDRKSRDIVKQMRQDELGHATLAEKLGAAELPEGVRSAMRLTARVMTTVAEHV